jgi:hypothetical protein
MPDITTDVEERVDDLYEKIRQFVLNDDMDGALALLDTAGGREARLQVLSEMASDPARASDLTSDLPLAIAIALALARVHDRDFKEVLRILNDGQRFTRFMTRLREHH